MTQETTETVTVDHEALAKFVASVVEETGVGSDDAAIVADMLVDANLRGIDTHGVVRLEPYVERLTNGGMNPSPDISVEQTRTATAIVDADDAPGAVGAHRGMEEAIGIATNSGGAFVGITNSSHFGTASYYTNYAAEQGYIGISMTHAGPNVTPFGGADPYFGTNPISFSLPRREKFPVTIDMATSVTAKGSVILAEENDETIPEAWAVDEAGKPITDPADFHALRPMAGPKGYGLGLMVDAFCGVLLNTVFGDAVPTLYDRTDTPQDLAQFVIAVDPGAFTDKSGFFDRLEEMIDDLHTARPRPEFDRVLLPGEPEAITKSTRIEDGIPITVPVWETLNELAEEYETQLPDVDG